MQTIFTNNGLNTIILASTLGPKLEINGVKISSNIYDPYKVNIGAFTGLKNIVWSGGLEYIRYQAKTTQTLQKAIMFVVTLDESIGPFDIGTIGLYSGTNLISCTCFDTIERKLVGNRNVIEVMFSINGSAKAMNVEMIVPDECSIPYVPTQEALPSLIEAPFSAYAIGNHTEFNTPCIAARGANSWNYYLPTTGTGDALPDSMWASNVKIGDLVYFNTVTNKLELANGDATGCLGFRGVRNNLVVDGVYVNNSFDLIPGAKYYCGTNGTITRQEGRYFVGEAVSQSTLYIGVFSETVLSKVDTIDVTRKSRNKYISEMAIVNKLDEVIAMLRHETDVKVNNILTKDNTFTGHMTFTNVINGYVKWK